MPDALAHDLRGLLQRARAHLDLLEQGKSEPAKLRAYLDAMQAMVTEPSIQDLPLRPIADEAAAQAALPVAVTGEGDGRVDHGSLLRILSNLLENAQRHATTASIAIHPNRIEIRDDGAGLADDQAFKMGHSGDGRTGLGLATCRHLAQSMGGRLEWESGVFVFYLPATNQTVE